MTGDAWDPPTHDPLCAINTGIPGDACDCDLIAKVRADEGKRNAIAEVERAWAERADLRAKVAGLPVERRSPRGVALVERVRVLALVDGSSDE